MTLALKALLFGACAIATECAASAVHAADPPTASSGTPSEPTPTTSTVSVPVSAAADAEEVTVKGRPRDPGHLTLRANDVQQLPGAFGDAFRAIEAFPGVTPMASGLPYFFIRGAPPGDTGFFIDGVRVPLLFHAAVGPSVIHPELVDHVDFYPGAAPAQYGRFAGGILSAATPAPARVEHVEATVRAFDAGALAEAPLADGRASALAAGRYSYSGLLLSASSPVKVAYWDYQTRETWNIDEKNRIGIFAFGSFDDFAQVKAGVTDTIIDADFHRVDLRYDHALDQGTLRVATTLGYSRSNNSDNAIGDYTVGVRANFEQRLTPAVMLRAGADATLDRFDPANYTGTGEEEATLASTTALLYPRHTDVAAGGWMDVVWNLGPRVQVVPGLRADVFTSHRAYAANELAQTPPTDVTLAAVDPRLSARANITRDVVANFALGLAHQPAAFVIPVPGLTFVEPHPVLQTAVEMSQGVAVALPEGFSAELRDS